MEHVCRNSLNLNFKQNIHVQGCFKMKWAPIFVFSLLLCHLFSVMYRILPLADCLNLTFMSFLSTDLVFSWIFNEYPTFVKQDTRRFISQETGNLYIAKVEPSDVGNYTCVVTNTVTKTRVQGPRTPLVLRSDGEARSWRYNSHAQSCDTFGVL